MDKLVMCRSTEIINKSNDTDHAKSKNKGTSQSKELNEVLEICLVRL